MSTSRYLHAPHVASLWYKPSIGDYFCLSSTARPPPHSICAADLAKLPLSVLRCSSPGSEAALGVADGELLDEWKTNGIHWKMGP